MSAAAEPLVSVVVPTYKHEAYIDDALRSVCEQTYRNLEIIVVDDHTPDNTMARVKVWEARDPRIRSVLNRGKGDAGAMNHGMLLSRGEFIAILPSDDLLTADSVAERVAAFQRSGPNVGLVYGQAEAWDDTNGEVLGVYGLEPPPDWTVSRPHFAYFLVHGNGAPAVTIMYRKAVLDRVGLFSKEYPASGDFDLTMRIALHEDLVFIPGVIARYRRHPGSSALAYERARVVEDSHTRMRRDLLARKDLPDDVRALAGKAWGRVYTELAYTHFEGGHPADARRCARLALEHDPEHPNKAEMRRLLSRSMLPRPVFNAARSALRVARSVASGQGGGFTDG